MSEQIISAEPEKKQIIQALTYIKNETPRAGKTLFNLILNTSEDAEIKTIAWANQALLSAKGKACDFFDEPTPSALMHKNLIPFLHALCLLKSPASNQEQKNKAQNILSKITQQKKDYYQLASIELINIQQHQVQKLPSLIQQLLDNNPYLTEKEFYHVLIDRSIYSWPQILSTCENIYSKAKNNKWLIAFLGYCQARAGFYELAQQSIQKALNLDKQDALLKALHAYIAYQINLKTKALHILKDALKFNTQKNYQLPNILKARFCDNASDLPCEQAL